MANTFELIASSTAGSGGTASFDFTSIPSTYTDLVLKLSVRGNYAGNADDYINLRFNGDSGSNYSMRLLAANAASNAAVSSSWSSQNYGYVFNMDAATATSSTFGNVELYIPNYAGSTAKSWSNDGVPENNASGFTNRGASLTAGLWTGTAAINQITLTGGGSSLFVQYSTAYLYGVKNA